MGSGRRTVQREQLPAEIGVAAQCERHAHEHQQMVRVRPLVEARGTQVDAGAVARTDALYARVPAAAHLAAARVAPDVRVERREELVGLGGAQLLQAIPWKIDDRIWVRARGPRVHDQILGSSCLWGQVRVMQWRVGKGNLFADTVFHALANDCGDRLRC